MSKRVASVTTDGANFSTLLPVKAAKVPNAQLCMEVTELQFSGDLEFTTEVPSARSLWSFWYLWLVWNTVYFVWTKRFWPGSSKVQPRCSFREILNF